MSGNFDKAIETTFALLINESVNVHLLHPKDAIAVQDPVTRETIKFIVSEVRRTPMRKAGSEREIPVITGVAQQSAAKWRDPVSGKFIQKGINYVIFTPPGKLMGNSLVSVDLKQYNTVDARLKFINDLITQPVSPATTAGSAEPGEPVQGGKGIGGWIRKGLYDISDPGKLNVGKDILSRGLGAAYTGAVRKVADLIGKEKAGGDPYAWVTSKFRKTS